MLLSLLDPAFSRARRWRAARANIFSPRLVLKVLAQVVKYGTEYCNDLDDS